MWARLATGGSSVASQLQLFNTGSWAMMETAPVTITATYSRICMQGVQVAATTKVMLVLPLGFVAGTFYLDDFTLGHTDPVAAVVTQASTSFEGAPCTTCAVDGFWVSLQQGTTSASWKSAAAAHTGASGLAITITSVQPNNPRAVLLMASS